MLGLKSPNISQTGNSIQLPAFKAATFGNLCYQLPVSLGLRDTSNFALLDYTMEASFYNRPKSVIGSRDFEDTNA